MGELQERIKDEATSNLALWKMAGNFITEKTAKRKDYIRVETALKIIHEMLIDLVLPCVYMHRSHRHKGKYIETTAFLDKDLEEFKSKLEKWLKDE